MEVDNLSIKQCEGFLKIADNEGYVNIYGFGKVHQANFERRIQELKNQ